MPTLYEIADELLRLSQSDELTEQELTEQLNNLVGDFTTKAENIARLVRNLESDATAYDTEAKRLADHKKSAQNRAQWLKRYLTDNMNCLELKRLDAGLFKLAIQKNPPRVVIDAEAELPPQYLEQITEIRIDKNAIKDAITAGATVPGAHIEQGESLRIR
ncbi:MAG: siphovirus Gp157 family protein [Desulfuromonadaceae bacterium]|nr:siphovirus Gp157 family protein [Desulfuromonadaceae bacterium]